MQILNKIQGQYDQLWKFIIRPTRTPYPDAALGPETFCLENIKVKRNSFQLINSRGQVFYGSHFVPLQSTNYPCLIYLHGNSSNQTQGMEYLSLLIKSNISLCTFDFSGCGNSQGQYVSLGYNQWQDVQQVINYVQAKQKITKIGLWGRSMGAVAALRYAAKFSNIAVAVYDSPFKSLKNLIGDLCKKNTKIPMFVLSGALKIISSTIKQKANFDVYDLNPLKNEAPVIKTPGFFIVSEQDELIPFQHTKQLFQTYKSKKKQIRIVKGQHNATRPEACVQDALKFIKKYLFKQQKDLSKSKDLTASGTKIQEVDFFNDQYQQSSNKDQKVTPKEADFDFFNEQAPNQKDIQNFQKQFSLSSQNNKQSQSSGTLLSSLNQMFAGVFSTSSKSKRPKLVHDGYQQIRALTAQLFARNNQKGKQTESRVEKQLKQSDNSFQKMFKLQPQIFIW